MIPELRDKFNNNFTQQKYNGFLNELNSLLKYPTDFTVSETPLFLTDELNRKLIFAGEEIISQLVNPEFRNKMNGAIPENLFVQNEHEHPEFLQIDFGICKNENGEFIPKLIELQGFPSLYAYQYFLDKTLKKHFDIPADYTSYYSGLDGQSYTRLFKNTILGNSNPENVILLEITPEMQKTRIDFAATEKLTGISTVCISDVIQKNSELYYKRNGSEIKIERIYNRVIFDELTRNNVKFNLNFRSNLNVKWVAHPNWFFKISKYTLPLLSGKFVPKCYYLKKLENYPSNLENFVLKPLFSFAGHGVEVELTKSKLEKISDPENYILQEKVEYAPLIKTPEGYSKVEIRMMYIWNEKPQLVNNLVRMSKGKMMGVDFNKNKTWVGSNLAYHNV